MKGAARDLTQRRVERQESIPAKSERLDSDLANDDAKTASKKFVRILKPEKEITSLSNHLEPGPPDSDNTSRSNLYDVIKRNPILTVRQQDLLCAILNKYSNSLTTRPGKCHIFTYKFEVTPFQPACVYTRPVPFALRPAIRAQIQQLLDDDILELSQSPFINPLTIVEREGKKLRLCVDARRVNQYMVPDKERTPPMQELLQQFDGAKYMTSLDLEISCAEIK